MAEFVANIRVDMTGNSASGELGYVTVANASWIQIQFTNFYENIGGSFGYYGNGIPYGYVYTDTVYDYYDDVLTSWSSEGGLYNATDLYNLARSGNVKKLLSYLFYLDDDIYGSAYGDKLVGYNGDDYIDGWLGNDKLWGGPGRDAFFFAAGDGRDIIKDLSRKKDSIVLDITLAANMRDVKRAVEKYKKGVILDFGRDEIKIEGLKKNKVKKVDFDFVDYDL